MGLFGGKHGRPKPSLAAGAIPFRRPTKPRFTKPSKALKAPKKPWWKK